MSDEEEKAIVELKHFINMSAYWKLQEYTNSQIDSYIKTILNLIEKQQKEINQRIKLKLEKKDLIKNLGYCEQEYEQNGYLSVGKFKAIKQAIELIKKQSKEIEELRTRNQGKTEALEEWINGERVSIHCIHKDKIKAKIEEIDEVLKGQLIEKIRVYFEAQKEVLQSLLEKE